MTTRHTRSTILLLTTGLCLAPLLGSCDSTTQVNNIDQAAQSALEQTMKKLNTIVMYRERIRLPPGCTLIVTLEDVSRMDIPSKIIAQKTITLGGGPPYGVSLTYAQERIEARMRYSLRARIVKEGQLLFISTQRVDPFAAGVTEPVEIMLTLQKARADTLPSTTSLSNTYWKLLTLHGREAIPGAGGKELYMVLTDQQGVRGHAGCNGFQGSHEREGDTLTFGQLATTMKMCIDTAVMAQEISFRQALAAAKSFQIKTDTLSLLDEQGTVLATFVANSMQ